MRLARAMRLAGVSRSAVGVTTTTRRSLTIDSVAPFGPTPSFLALPEKYF
ncbi:MAG TPA: hypothetical protein VJ746_06630 [Nitrospira sp.]|nr:hypothetical protein [Nitrospira sp.]